MSPINKSIIESLSNFLIKELHSNFNDVKII